MSYFRVTFKLHLVLALFMLFVVLTQSCGDNPANAPGDHISGTITFVNTNFLTTGHYFISLFTYQSNAFCNNPVKSDTIQVNSSTQSYYYNMTNVLSGQYYVGVNFVPESNPPVSPWVLGTYGCDTTNASSCTNYTAVEFPSYSGSGAVNFFSQSHYNNRINTNCP
jgi:hypothetical protein